MSNNKLDSIGCVLVGVAFIIAFFLYNFYLYKKVNRMQEEGICTIGILDRVSRNNLHYTYIVNDEQKQSINGVNISPDKVGQLFPIVYLKEGSGNGYLVNYEIDTSLNKYGSDLCCEVCEEIKSKITYWDM